MLTIEKDRVMGRVSVADIALNHPQAIEILNRYNLDYCCNGKKSFVEVCQKENLDAAAIWEEIMEKQIQTGSDHRMKFNTWSPSLLVDFIVQHHHSYIKESIPHIHELLSKVCLVHASDQPELIEVLRLFVQLAEELTDHMLKEEVVLFPAIRRITARKDRLLESSSTINIRTPLSVMEHEHESAGDLLKTIRSLSNQYTPLAHACPTFQLTFKLLKEFDHDLMQHIHLENNILFPKVKSPQVG